MEEVVWEDKGNDASFITSPEESELIVPSHTLVSYFIQLLLGPLLTGHGEPATSPLLPCDFLKEFLEIPHCILLLLGAQEVRSTDV